jgi:hypothetical protein
MFTWTDCLFPATAVNNALKSYAYCITWFSFLWLHVTIRPTVGDPLPRKLGTKDVLDFGSLSQKIAAHANSIIKNVNICIT